MQNEFCELCHHKLEDNSHGLDQNDFDMTAMKHTGTCTYCKYCVEDSYLKGHSVLRKVRKECGLCCARAGDYISHTHQGECRLHYWDCKCEECV